MEWLATEGAYTIKRGQGSNKLRRPLATSCCWLVGYDTLRASYHDSLIVSAKRQLQYCQNNDCCRIYNNQAISADQVQLHLARQSPLVPCPSIGLAECESEVPIKHN